jgi:hypothetical protein
MLERQPGAASIEGRKRLRRDHDHNSRRIACGKDRASIKLKQGVVKGHPDLKPQKYKKIHACVLGPNTTT